MTVPIASELIVNQVIGEPIDIDIYEYIRQYLNFSLNIFIEKSKNINPFKIKSKNLKLFFQFIIKSQFISILVILSTCFHSLIKIDFIILIILIDTFLMPFYFRVKYKKFIKIFMNTYFYTLFVLYTFNLILKFLSNIFLLC